MHGGLLKKKIEKGRLFEKEHQRLHKIMKSISREVLFSCSFLTLTDGLAECNVEK